MQKLCKIFKNPCIFLRVIRPFNLCRQNLKLLKIKYEKTTDVPAWARLTSKVKKNTLILYLGHENSNTIFLSPTPLEDIEDLRSSMKTDKASGTNSIPTKILKFKKEFLKPLGDIINLSFNQGILPNLLKIANVIPIHKKSDKLDCNNYRPISLLSNISKIFGKYMHTH